MGEFDEKSITQAVIGRLAESGDPRFKQVMTSLITHLHDFVRDVKLTEPEWLAAVQFLTDVGQTCTRKRQEFILLSDTLGVSVLVISLNHPADKGSAESTVLGPFYWEGAPDLPRVSNLAEGVKGEPGFYSGRVLGEDGRPLENALLDIWSGDGEGNYDMQIPSETGMKARGRIRTDAAGRYWFRSIRPTFYPVPTDGAPSVSPGPHTHDRLGAGTSAGDDSPVRCGEPISGFRRRVRDEGVARGAIRPARSGSRSKRRARGDTVLYGQLRLPAEARGRSAVGLADQGAVQRLYLLRGGM